jgi:O-antigen/teichoic acid export membrane protein
MDKEINGGKNHNESGNKEALLRVKLKSSVTITSILGFLSVLAVIFLFLALSDIADKEENLTLEWYIAGFCILIISTFIISTFVTLAYVMKFTSIKKDINLPPVQER